MSRILVVDDEPELIKVLEFGLKLAGHEVLRATSFHEASAIMVEASVDVLVTDLHFPGGTGLDLIRKMREIRPNFYAFLLTGFTDFSHDAIEELGIVDVLYKPFDLTALVAQINALR